jgi:threonine dehydrogenase-like Zn-dependent dehydrogenase
MLVAVPAELSSADCAAVGCNLVDVHRTIAPHLTRFPEPDVLVVSGHGGTISLYAVAMAWALGVGRVDFLDDDPGRLAEAEALGARPVSAGALSRAGYPIVVDGSLMPDRLATGVGAVARDGVCTTMWPYPGSVSLPLATMFARGVTVTAGQPHARSLIDPVLELIRAGAIGSTAIPAEVLPWESAETAFGAGSTKRIFVRTPG